ncbi:hypothetical protein JTE90_027892 [Oedothorax gibbosus]|uniref:Spaetzle domain-containing protein n=1 Tax=Oedothorax gibbosus TaxID=931172 RepID=A0AAV6U8D6_9ARAC|nr:hypothetical protein JTE90_027892 [Oedothorax gibbosus]
MWLLPLMYLVSAVGSEPTDFGPYFGDDLGSFYSPSEGGTFGKFSGLSYHPGGSAIIDSEYTGSYASESTNLPLYTEEKAKPPPTFAKPGRGQFSNLRPNYPPPSIAGYGSAASSQHSVAPGRLPRFRSEPFSSASNVDERRHQYQQQSGSELSGKVYNAGQESPFASSAFKDEATPSFSSLANSQPVIQTGFVPIFSGQSKSKVQNPSILKDIPPPILTAESVSASAQPTVFKVSTSVLSSSKSPALQQPSNDSSSSHEDLSKPRQAAYSRALGGTADFKRVRVTSSESVVSRVVSSTNNKKQEAVPEESRLAAKKTLDINCEGSRDLGWCELGDKYPKKYVDQVVAACQDVIQRMYIEVPHNFEKLADTSNFKAEFNNSHREARERGGSHDAWSWSSYLHEGSLCDAETGFLRPETAKDSSGKWNIVVQTDTLKQRVPIEMCRKTNGPCQKMLNCGLKSQCLQKYNYHLLMSLNPTQKHDCPFMKLYRFPSACVCHVE